MEKLAMLGGERSIGKYLGEPWPMFGAEEERLLLEALRSGNWCRLQYRMQPQASKVAQFEDAFARYHDAQYAVAVTNGTQALECALKAAGIKSGDEVIVPALTFVATATAVALVNATPVIVDVDAESYNISPAAIEAAITSRTKAIIPVHNGGYPADMDAIMAIAGKHHLVVIEDCAHAHGTQWRGKGAGSLGHMGCFSFQQGKTMTAGEGGMILTNDEKYAAALFSYHNIGRVADRPFADEFSIVASNLRMTEFQAAVLLGQLSRFPEQVAVRERNIAYLAEGLAQIPGVRAIARDPRVTRWCFYFWNFHYLEEEFGGLPRNLFIRALQAEGVPINAGAHGEPIYQHPVLAGTGVARVQACPVAERVSLHEAVQIAPPAFLGPQEDMDLLLAAIRKVRANVAALLDAQEQKRAAS